MHPGSMHLDADTRSYDVLAAVADAGWPDGAVALPWRATDDGYALDVTVDYLDRELDGDYAPPAVRRSLADLVEGGALDRDTASDMAADRGMPSMDAPARNRTTFQVTRHGYEQLWYGQD